MNTGTDGWVGVRVAPEKGGQSQEQILCPSATRLLLPDTQGLFLSLAFLSVASLFS